MTFRAPDLYDFDGERLPPAETPKHAERRGSHEVHLKGEALLNIYRLTEQQHQQFEVQMGAIEQEEQQKKPPSSV